MKLEPVNFKDKLNRFDELWSPCVIAEMNDYGLPCVEQKRWRTQIEIGSDEIADALAMTYRAGRWSEQSLIASIDATKVTLAADLMQFGERR